MTPFIIDTESHRLFKLLMQGVQWLYASMMRRVDDSLYQRYGKLKKITIGNSLQKQYVVSLTFCINYTLLQGLTWFSATQTGCRWLISYIEQKKFLAWEPEFYVEFSAPPEFSGGVMENCSSTGEARASDLQIMIQVFYHCATAALYICEIKKLSLFLAGIFRQFL